MEIYTIGFTQKSAADFFGRLKTAGVRRLIDVRLHNVSQLSGFAKREDLRYFLREISDIEYIHEQLLAPSPELFNAYKKDGCSWDEYEPRFMELMEERRIDEHLGREFFTGPSVLLCSEPTAEHCHRRLILEYLQAKWGDIDPVHL